MNEDLRLYRNPANPPGALVPRSNGYVSYDVPVRGYSYAAPSPVLERSPILEYWDALRRHKLAILIIAACGLFVGGLISYMQTPVYRATTTIEIQGLNENVANFRSFDPNAAEQYSTEAYIQTQIRILKSDTMLNRVTSKLNYAARPEYAVVPQPSAWRKMLGVTKPVLPLEERILTSVRSRLRAEAAGLTRILELNYDSNDPKEASEFLNTLAIEYIAQAMEVRDRGTSATSQWLSGQLAVIKAKLETSDNQLQAYARTHGLNFTNEKENLAEEKLRQLQTQLSQAEAARIVKQSQFELARTSPADSLPEVLNDQTLRDYHAKLTELNRQLAELSTALTPEHYKVQRLKAQITEVRGALEQQRTNIVTRIRNEFDAAQRQESLLRGQYTAQQNLVSSQAGGTVQYNVLKREVDANRQMYDALLQRMKEANMASALRTSGVRVVDPAVVPTLPYKPNVVLNAGVGLFGGLLLAMGFAVVRMRTDGTVQMPGEVTSSLAIPELGLIPAGNGKNLALATWERKVSPIAESFRSTVASIMFTDGSDGTASRVVVFTSANPGEGKSTVVSNVAIAWAQTKRQRILLIDADTRRPVQHKFFSATNNYGLSDLLSGADPIDESAVMNAVQSTFVPELSILPCGASDVVTLLYSPRLQEILTVCRQKFDVVLIDTPPMLQMPDARILGRLADRVILVVRSGHTARGAALFAAQKFAEDGTPIFGSILNSVDIGRSAYMYRGY